MHLSPVKRLRAVRTMTLCLLLVGTARGEFPFFFFFPLINIFYFFI